MLRQKKILIENIRYLEERGIHINNVYIDNISISLVILFDDLEAKYVDVIRNLTGYDVPILLLEEEENTLITNYASNFSSSDLYKAYKTLIIDNDPKKYSIVTAFIDKENNLLHIEVWDLNESIVGKIQEVIGKNVPVEYTEFPAWPWNNKILIGKPLHVPIAYEYQGWIDDLNSGEISSYNLTKLLDAYEDLLNSIYDLPIISLDILIWKYKGIIEIGVPNLEYSIISKIYDLVSNNIPLAIKEENIHVSERDSRYRPLIGGIRITTYDSRDSEWEGSTLAFSAVDNDGNLGYVIAGHAGEVNDPVYQPYYNSNNLVGHVNRDPHLGRSSDAAWVEYTDVSPYILGEYYDTYVNLIVKGVIDPVVNYGAEMEGAVSGEVYGTILQVDVLKWNPEYGFSMASEHCIYISSTR